MPFCQSDLTSWQPLFKKASWEGELATAGACLARKDHPEDCIQMPGGHFCLCICSGQKTRCPGCFCRVILQRRPARNWIRPVVYNLLGLGAAGQAEGLPSQARCSTQDSNPQQRLLEGAGAWKDGKCLCCSQRCSRNGITRQEVDVLAAEARRVRPPASISPKLRCHHHVDR